MSNDGEAMAAHDAEHMAEGDDYSQSEGELARDESHDSEREMRACVQALRLALCYAERELGRLVNQNGQGVRVSPPYTETPLHVTQTSAPPENFTGTPLH